MQLSNVLIQNSMYMISPSSLLEQKGSCNLLNYYTMDPLLMSAREVAHAQEVTH